MEAFRGAGLKSRLDEIRSFLTIYPYHAEARLVLLGELRAIAQAKTRAALGMQQGGINSATFRSAGAMGFPMQQSAGVGDASAEPLPQLDIGMDGEIWGEYSREAENAFQEGIWKQDTEQLWGDRRGMGIGAELLFRRGGTSFVSDFAIYSQMMKKQYQRWLPDIEYAIGRRASSTPLWNFWLAVQRAAGGRDISVFKALLVPSVDGESNDMPPPFVRSQWIRDCINRGDMRMAEGVAREEWDNLLVSQVPWQNTRQGRPSLTGGRAFAMNVNGNSFQPMAWNTVAEPYLEILLRQQKMGAADALLQQWLAMEGWQGAVQRAGALAIRLGLQDLAAKWDVLAPSMQPLENRRMPR
jgi:hypothetical protein